MYSRPYCQRTVVVSCHYFIWPYIPYLGSTCYCGMYYSNIVLFERNRVYVGLCVLLTFRYLNILGYIVALASDSGLLIHTVCRGWSVCLSACWSRS